MILAEITFGNGSTATVTARSFDGLCRKIEKLPDVKGIRAKRISVSELRQGREIRVSDGASR